MDAFGLHAVGGIVGAVLTGGVLQAMKSLKLLTLRLLQHLQGQLWVQVEGVLATMVYSAEIFIILKVIDLVIGIRVSADDERMGLDLSQHGERIE